MQSLVDRICHGLTLVRARSTTEERLNSGGLPVFPFIWIEGAHSSNEAALGLVMTPFISHLDEFPVVITVSKRQGVERLGKCAFPHRYSQRFSTRSHPLPRIDLV